jgi:hypothetical protein
MTVELIIEPSSDELDADDPRWANQVNELLRSLKAEGDVRRASAAGGEGKKGDPLSVAIILALGSSGAITAVSRMLTEWMKRRKCSMTVSYDDGETVKKMKLTAEGMTPELVAALTKKLGP